jgi:hypothetical protein
MGGGITCVVLINTRLLIRYKEFQMKTLLFKIPLFLVGIFFVALAQARAPSEHAKTQEKPKCEPIKNMDHSKLDTNDPVMMAVMKKCRGEFNAENKHTEEPVTSHVDSSDPENMDQHGGRHDHPVAKDINNEDG